MLGPQRVAKMMVERRERVSWAIVRRRAVVGVVVGSPTPTPVGEGGESVNVCCAGVGWDDGWSDGICDMEDA